MKNFTKTIDNQQNLLYSFIHKTTLKHKKTHVKVYLDAFMRLRKNIDMLFARKK